MSELTHIDESGRVRMVDVTEKKPTQRTAVAQAVVHMSEETFQRITRRYRLQGKCPWKRRASPASWALKKPPT